MPTVHDVSVSPARCLRGALSVPGDKSISHRYGLMAAIAEGSSLIEGYAPGADCASTLAAVEGLGARVSKAPLADGRAGISIDGRGTRGFSAPAGAVDCGNSGSTMRMLAGLLAAQPFTTVLTGDASLSNRPMGRIIDPLTAMGADLEAGPGGRAPLRITGAALKGIAYRPPVASAQVKSAVLLAGLGADGVTRVSEPAATRDHTERAIRALGGRITVDGLDVSVEGGQTLHGRRLRVPGDLSSAAFFLVAAAAMPGSRVQIDNVGLNPTRTGLLRAIERLGATLHVEQTDAWQGEPVGSVTVGGAGPTSVVITPDEVPGLIDELPVLAAWATFGGRLSVTGAGELRVKESDRITALVTGLRALGADADESPDGFEVRGTRPLTGGVADAADDHRLAMAFAVAALGASGPSVIAGASAVAVSYPSFFDDMERLRA